MHLEIIQKKENQLLSRVEVEGKLTFDKQTPSNKDVLEQLHKKLGVDAALIVIKKIQTTYGDHSATVFAYHYTSDEQKNKVEPIKRVKAQAAAA